MHNRRSGLKNVAAGWFATWALLMVGANCEETSRSGTESALSTSPPGASAPNGVMACGNDAPSFHPSAPTFHPAPDDRYRAPAASKAALKARVPALEAPPAPAPVVDRALLARQARYLSELEGLRGLKGGDGLAFENARIALKQRLLADPEKPAPARE